MRSLVDRSFVGPQGAKHDFIAPPRGFVVDPLAEVEAGLAPGHRVSGGAQYAALTRSGHSLSVCSVTASRACGKSLAWISSACSRLHSLSSRTSALDVAADILQVWRSHRRSRHRLLTMPTSSPWESDRILVLLRAVANRVAAGTRRKRTSESRSYSACEAGLTHVRAQP